MVLSTMGSLGDLYPVLSIARHLDQSGIEVRLALSPDDCDMARRWGLLATPVGPSEAEICERLGVTRDQIAREVLRDPGPLIRDVLIPMLPALTEELAPLTYGAAVVAATAFALHAPLAAERAGLPYVPLILQPMMLFSALDPPRSRRFGATVPSPANPLTRAWNRAWIGAARAVLRARHAADLTRVRAGFGLPPQPGTPLLDHGATVPLRLGLWSDRFAPAPADRPDDFEVVGFPAAPDGDLPQPVIDWLDAGPAPLVVTLGSVAQRLGGERFWAEAVALARRMGLRAVLLRGEAEVPEGPDILSLHYAPHAPLFPRAAAVLHHGGIGSTAEALRAGRPQLVVPVGGDQPDNAARLERMGVAVSIDAKRFRAARAAARLTDLLGRFDYGAAATLGEAIAGRNGASIAALHLARLALQSRPRPLAVVS
ncbi:glycosyltransferase [uncultured Jannaschia sp.]|uniref:glycosyltransferase n=1 Tax=uncultured Jannaschia sp. TaxID=293347 RepID=UPI00260C86DC|nr:glycosyltransferase [uncultured Jannaschia sp.]